MQNNYVLSALWRCFITVIAMTIVLLGALRFFKPFYLYSIGRDIDLKVVSNGEANRLAKGTNVRISSIEVNGGGIDLSQLELEGKWHYSDKDDFIYCYDAREPSALNIPLKNVGTIKITFVSEVGSGIVSVDINDQNWVEQDLYSNSDWGYISFSKDLVILWTPEKHMSLLGALFMICFAGRLIFARVFRRNVRRSEYNCACEVIFALAGSSVLILSSYLIQYKDMTVICALVKESPEAVLDGLMFLTLGFLVFHSLIRSRWIAFSGIAVIVIAVSIVSDVKETYRGVPLLPWDFMRIGEALSVAGGYKVKVDNYIALAVALSVLFGCFLFFTKDRKRSVRPLFKYAQIFCVLALLLIYVQTTFIDFRGKRINVFSVSDYYSKNGAVTSIMDYLKGLYPPDAPEDYSPAAVREIGNGLSVQKQKANTPNVIVIMSESFWDITRMDSVVFNEDPLPVYHQLQNECIHGNALSHVFGGGTEISEYEFLTGFSGEFFPESYIVYGNDLKKGFESAVSLLESQGYSSVAIHPYLGSNYNRSTAYQTLGFDKFITEEDFGNNTQRIRNYISDQAMYERIMNEVAYYDKESGRPQFIFAVSMQNHGGYWPDTLYADSQVSFKSEGLSELTQGCMADYVAGLHESDRALGEFLEGLKDYEEETVVIFFGDHMSEAGPKTEKMLDNEKWKNADEYTQDYEEHIVPVLIWNNKGNNNKDLGMIEINQIFPFAAAENQMAMPKMWSFLTELHDFYSASDKMIMVDKDGTVRPLEDISEIQGRMRNQYGLLQYDYIWGKRYAGDLWKID